MRDDLRQHFCRSCLNNIDNSILTIRNLPALNRFNDKIQDIDRRDFSLSYCSSCGLLQQINDIDVAFVKPTKPWINYNEPEAHLESFIEHLKDINPCNGCALGVGPFDMPLLRLLIGLGMQTDCLELRISEEIEGYPYLETIQENIKSSVLSRLIKKNMSYDIITCRYILEHCNSPLDSLKSFSPFLKKDGLLIIEIPDSAKFIGSCDYSFLWEEHVSYFVEDTICNLVNMAGYDIISMNRYNGVLEDSLILTLRLSDGGNVAIKAPDKKQLLSMEYYIQYFQKSKNNYLKNIMELSREGKKIALIGVGHQALMFIHSMDLKGFIDYYIDDNPDKVGTYPPGINSKIISSKYLAEDTNDVQVFLVALNPGSASNVIKKIESSGVSGATFYSIFSKNEHACGLEKLK